MIRRVCVWDKFFLAIFFCRFYISISNRGSMTSVSLFDRLHEVQHITNHTSTILSHNRLEQRKKKNTKDNVVNNLL